MHVQFDTNDLSQRDALCLMALLENIAGVEVPLKLSEKEAVRHESTFKPEAVEPKRERSAEDQEQKDRAVREHETTEKPKRGRPRKEQAAEVPVVDPTAAAVAAGLTPSEGPITGSAAGAASEPASTDGPISMDDLRDAVNDHVSRNGMPSAQMVFKEFGCQRANEIMALEPAQQHAFLAKMKK